tara:strand:+ start:287 stop:1081 length:795 start_codon:yes stop_codon:yes gene_type:complete
MNFVRDIIFNYKYRSILTRTTSLANTKSGKALIMANGSRLLPTIKKAREDGFDFSSVSIFAINNYILHQNLVALSPDYYVLIDPDYFAFELTDNDLQRAAEGNHCSLKDSEYILNEAQKVSLRVFNSKTMSVFIPSSQFHKVRSSNIYPFNSSCSPASSNIYNITRTLSWRPMTGYVAISIALYLGFDEIYLAGFDNDSWRTIASGSNPGTLNYQFPHFYTEPSSFMNKYTSDMDAACFMASAASIYRLHRRIKMINLDIDGLY